jgi:hypothetical protein
MDNPRRLGKSWVRLVDPAPPNRAAKRDGGSIHQFLWRGSHPVTMRMRDLAASSDEKPLRAESSSSGWFRAWANRSHPEGGQLLLCISTVRTTLAGLYPTRSRTAQRKTPKGGQKERAYREEHGNPARSVKNFQAPAMLKTTPLDCEIKRNLREKRRDPWPRANAPSQAVADPEPVVKTRK